MLVRLFAENFGVFRDGFDLPLEAVDLGTDRDRGYFEVDVKGEDRPLRLLRLAAIYGPNGSGKSTVVRAAHALHGLAVHSGPRSQESKRIPYYDPFRLDSATRDKPCVLGCEVVVNGSVVEYRVSFTKRRIVSERIAERTEGEDNVWLERDTEGVHVFEQHLSGPLSVDLSSVTRSNATAISVAAQLNQAPLLGVFEALQTSLRTLNSDGAGMLTRDYSLRMLHENPGFRDWTLRRLLAPADTGITGVKTEEREAPPEFLERLSEFVDADVLEDLAVQIEAVFSHRGVDGEYRIDLSDESAGTQKMIALAGPWYDVVHNGLTVFVDELSASLHPTLLMALLDAFNGPPSRSPSQLIFTVHDPSPLEDVLRRDQVYFTEKGDDGVAKLFALSEFRDRSVHNIRKRYLEGRYGALPRLPDFGSLFDPPEN